MTQPTTTSGATDPAVHTFLIADVRGYTRYTLEHGDEAGARLAARFATVAREGVAGHDGEVIELRGDEALAVFSSARQALRAAVDLQDRFLTASREDAAVPLNVGIGLDAGEAIPMEGGYRGGALNLAARLCSLAGPGEVLASDGVIHLARRMDGLSYLERGLIPLKGFSEPVRVVQVRYHEGEAPDTATPPEGEARREERSLPIGGFLGALPASILVARDGELSRLIAALEGVAGGSGRLAMLAGEPGVGKTRLAQELTLQARNRDFIVATGRCYEGEATIPYYPWLEALNVLHGEAPIAVRAESARRWPDLGRLLPDTIGSQIPSTGSGSEEQQQLFRAVTGFVIAVAEEIPIAIMLDDLHWADASSLKLLQHLARFTRGHRVLLLGTYRDVEVGRQHPLEGAIRDLEREGLLERIPVRRLDEEGTAELIAATMGEREVSDEFSALVHGRTEGNPFFVQQVLRVLVERGDVFQRDGRWGRKDVGEIEVPESVRSVIGQRLSRLSETTQDVLHEASVLGQTFNFDELLALSDRSEKELEQALDEARKAGLVRESGRDGYAFDHALTQGSLYGELSARRRRRLHLAAGETLQELPERKRQQRAAELAWHFLEGDDPERAIPFALLAGDSAAAVFAHAEAEWHYRTAIDLSRETEDGPDEADALLKLGRVLTRAGRFVEALEHLERAERLYRDLGDRTAELDTVADIASTYSYKREPVTGISRIDAALETSIEGADPRSVARLYTSLAQLLFGSGQNIEAYEPAMKAAALARQIGDTQTLGIALMRAASSLAELGRSDEAISLYREALGFIEDAGDVYSAATAINNLSVVHLLRAEIRENLKLRLRALEINERIGNPGRTAFALGQVCESYYFAGEWGQAEVYGERALQMARGMEVSWFSPYPINAVSALYIARGQWGEIIPSLEEGMRLAQESGDDQAFSFAARRLGEIAIRQGNPAQAITRLEPIASLRTPWTLSIFAWAHIANGDETRAEDLVHEILARAHSEGITMALIENLWVLGMLRIRQGRWDEAETALNEGLELTRRAEYPYFEARYLYQLGLVDRGRGEIDRSRERLQTALTIFGPLGATPEVEETERALAGDITLSATTPVAKHDQQLAADS